MSLFGLKPHLLLNVHARTSDHAQDFLYTAYAAMQAQPDKHAVVTITKMTSLPGSFSKTEDGQDSSQCLTSGLCLTLTLLLTDTGQGLVTPLVAGT